jgi:hypothetical protein
VKLAHPVVRSVDGAMIYDSLLGKTGAIRFAKSQDWQRFETWRLVPESRTMTVTIEMHGLGEILVDDLRITAVPLPHEIAEAPRQIDPEVKPTKFSPLDPLDLRRFTPMRNKQ